MFTRTHFHQRQFTRARSIALWALCAVLFSVVLAAFNTGVPRHRPA